MRLDSASAPGISVSIIALRPQCPDCGAEWIVRGNELGFTHYPACLLVAAGEAVMAEDRAWFEDNPWALYRERPLSAAECRYLSWMCLGADVVIPEERIVEREEVL